jgi:hypothetical protein
MTWYVISKSATSKCENSPCFYNSKQNQSATYYCVTGQW